MTKVRKKKTTRNQNKTLLWVIVAISIIIISILIIQSINGRSSDHALSISSSSPNSPSEPTALQTGIPSEITPAQTKKFMEDGAFILDVREPSEWVEGHIDGATLIPLAELPNRLNELPKDIKIVVVCRSGNRSAQGRDILLNAGFPQVTSLAGGMNAWQSQGYPTVTGN